MEKVLSLTLEGFYLHVNQGLAFFLVIFQPLHNFKRTFGPKCYQPGLRQVTMVKPNRGLEGYTFPLTNRMLTTLFLILKLMVEKRIIKTNPRVTDIRLLNSVYKRTLPVHNS